ncbi:hypothetical protein ABFS83_07G095000 [Erythranthe nasuta]
MNYFPNNISSLLLTLLVISLSPLLVYPHSHEDFVACLSHRSAANQDLVSTNVYTPINSSYTPTLQFSIRNPRFRSSATANPQVIITPVNETQIPDIVHCAKYTGLQIRTRGGGHDYEGVSYQSPIPFVMVDLIKMREIVINREEETAWVQAGATLGELYYRISQTSRTLAFPAGGCFTVGVGGHISGGGYGALIRKFGIAAEHVVDARIIDVNGRILDRKSMGEELFWAIRGGGGGSFGIVSAWKMQLVRVPETLTIFTVNRTLEQNLTQLVHRWQYVAPNLPNDLFVAMVIRNVNTTGGNRTVQATFISLFLGGVDNLLPLLADRFPELGVRREDCTEVTWVQAAMVFGNRMPNASTEVLRTRAPYTNNPFKAKSDYIQEPIPVHGFEGLWKLFGEKEAKFVELNWAPYGGRMWEVPANALPFPHRRGNLYKILHLLYWDEPGREASERHVNWMRKMYAYLEPFVSKNPRGAYINYRDLDIGVNNNEGNTSYAQASEWGLKYFKTNFKRLVRIKTMADPTNFFRHEQSIPTLRWKRNH